MLTSNTLISLIVSQIEQKGNKPAVICGDEQKTYQEIYEESFAISNHLLEMNLPPNSNIGVMPKRSAEFVSVVLGILNAGHAYMPIPLDFPADRVRKMMKYSKAPLMYFNSECQHDAQDSYWQCYDKILKTGDRNNFQGTEIDNKDTIYIIYSSGTTNTPKAVMIPDEAVVSFYEAVKTRLSFTGDERVMAVCSLSFDLSMFELLISMAFGMTIILCEDESFQPKGICDLIGKHKADTIIATPTMMKYILSYSSGQENISSLRTIMLGGEILFDSLVREIRKYTDGRIVNVYGPCEATMFVSTAEVKEGEQITIGKPLSNCKIILLDEEGGEVPDGTIGEMCIIGSNVGTGYIGLPYLNKEKFGVIDGKRCYRTGDLGRRLNDGNLIFCGRRDNQLKINGFRIELEEIENVLMMYEGIRNVVVLPQISVNSEYTQLNCYYTANLEIPEVKLREYLSKKLPYYMRPSHFIRAEFIPFNENGKVNRKVIPAPYNKQKKGKTQTVSDRDTIGVLSMIIELLDENDAYAYEEITPESLLETVGLTSITFIKLVVELETKYEIEFDDSDLNSEHFKTVDDIVKYVEQKARYII